MISPTSHRQEQNRDVKPSQPLFTTPPQYLELCKSGVPVDSLATFPHSPGSSPGQGGISVTSVSQELSAAPALGEESGFLTEAGVFWGQARGKKQTRSSEWPLWALFSSSVKRA